jgi:hypothetical protein
VSKTTAASPCEWEGWARFHEEIVYQHTSRYLIDFSYAVKHGEMYVCVRLNRVTFTQTKHSEGDGYIHPPSTKVMRCKWIPMKDIDESVDAKKVSTKDNVLGRAVRELCMRLIPNSEG